MANPATDQLFKFLIIGDSGTGKSCLLRYFIEKKFKKGFAHTIGVEFGSKVVEVGGRKVKLQIWDTAGQERFRSVTRSYYRGAIGCLLVYDISNRDSYDHLMGWLIDARSLGRNDIQVVVVGNKTDLAGTQREVTLLEASAFAQENDLLFMETSAVTGDCVDEVFLKCASAILQKIDNGLIDVNSLINKTSTAPVEAEEKSSSCAC